MNNTDVQDKRLKELADLQDPNEFIAACRRMAAEENQISEGELFPLTEDALGDVISTFLGIWLTMTINLPVENNQQVIASIENMIEMLKQMREQISKEDWEHFRLTLLRLVKRAMAPRLWEI